MEVVVRQLRPTGSCVIIRIHIKKIHISPTYKCCIDQFQISAFEVSPVKVMSFQILNQPKNKNSSLIKKPI